MVKLILVKQRTVSGTRGSFERKSHGCKRHLTSQCATKEKHEGLNQSTVNSILHSDPKPADYHPVFSIIINSKYFPVSDWLKPDA